MRWLLDTNILLRLGEVKHPMHRTALHAVDLLHGRGETLFTTPQNFMELWAIATRPAEKNGRGMTSSEANQEIERLHDLFPLAPDGLEIYPAWRHLVVTREIKGQKAFDARLVAVMFANGLTHLLTFNTQDFRKYTEITSVDPKEIR